MRENVKEGKRQLDNPMHYTRVDKDPTVQIAKSSNQIVQDLHSFNHISDKTRDWALVEPHKVRTQRFYHQPKIHKSLVNPPGRPIVSGIDGPTDTLSKLADSWLQDVVTRLPSYIKDSTHVLHLLEEWNMMPTFSCKNNIPYSQLLRARRLCSKEEDFSQRCNEITVALKRRGYKASTLKEARERESKPPLEQKLFCTSQRRPTQEFPL